MNDRIDPQLHRLLRAELRRQQQTLSLIPSENAASTAILEVTGSVLTNKYSEGYPGRRYYGGNLFVDQIEQLAIRRVKKLFGAAHANVQPHAGAIANLAVYSALLQPRETILAMDLRAGGHLTHGHPRNISGQLYTIIPYGLTAEGYIDYAQLESLAAKYRPKIIVSGASAYPRHIDFSRIGTIAKNFGAYHLADIAHIAGLVAAKLHQNPVPHADVITFTTHKTFRGPRGAVILSTAALADRIDRAVMPGIQGGPLDHIIAAKAQAFAEAATPAFRAYQRQILKNAVVLADVLRAGGLVLSSGGTDTHLILVDVTPLGIAGAQAEKALESIGLIANKNLIANDPRKPLDPSGLRLGTPGVTTRGMKEKDMRELGAIIVARLRSPRSQVVQRALSKRVQRLVRAFPLYPHRTI